MDMDMDRLNIHIHFIHSEPWRSVSHSTRTLPHWKRASPGYRPLEHSLKTSRKRNSLLFSNFDSIFNSLHPLFYQGFGSPKYKGRSIGCASSNDDDGLDREGFKRNADIENSIRMNKKKFVRTAKYSSWVHSLYKKDFRGHTALTWLVNRSWRLSVRWTNIN